jgi:plasmid stabilization system protein ParE
MPRIELVPAVLDDIDRILYHLTAFNVPDPAQRIANIIEAMQILAQNPEIGRRANNAMRELIVGQRSRGYIVLYRFIPDIDTVFILAIRSHREAGYR